MNLSSVARRGARSAAVSIGACLLSTGALAADAQPPTAPATLKADSLTCRAVALTWSASTDNVAVIAYDIYHDGQQIDSVKANRLSDKVLVAPNASWVMYVNARDAAGNVSQPSPTVPIKAPPCQIDHEPPSTPTNVHGSAVGTTVTLAWTASTDKSAVAGYDVYRNGSKAGSTAAVSYTDAGLTANTTYSYTVTARDAQGNVSPPSAAAAVTTGSACSDVVCSIVQVGTDLDLPWGLAVLPDGSLYYSRRDAHDIVRLDPVSGAKTTLGTVPNVQSTDGEGGLMGLAVTPAFPASDPWLYIFHTSPSDNRIVRIQVKAGVLDTTTLQVLVSGIARNIYHNGGRLRFGPDGKLYASTGDALSSAYAQDLSKLNGKVLRLNPDGSVPSDNPFGSYVWSYGHRNPQGLAFDSQGRLWEQEFGNGTMDETNLIQKGGNYGWPNCEGTSSQGGSGCATPGYIAPKATYSVVEGSCSGIAIVRDALYIACERGMRLVRHVISGSDLTSTQQLLMGTYNRLRTVEPTRDGGLWLTTTTKGDKDSTPNNGDEKVLKVNLGN